MEPGDVAVLFTDGVREARPRQGDPFGLDRAIDVVRSHQHEPSRQIIHRLEAAVRRYCHPHAPHDDLTIVVVKVSPAARFSPFAKR